MQFSMKKISLLILLVAMCLSVLGCQLVIDRHEGDNTAPVDSVTEPAAPDTEYTPDTPPVTEDDTTEILDTEPATSEPDTTETDTTEEPELPVEPEFVHPLTGLAETKSLQRKGPLLWLKLLWNLKSPLLS